jgi:hypothetical protein
LPRHRLGQRRQIDREELAEGADALGRIERPRTGRRTEVEHALPFSKKPDLAIDRFELEDASRRKAALFRLAGESIGPTVGVVAP